MTTLQKRKIEILAPAGNMQMALAAVRCGANAIYLGAKAFNARRNAENFTDEQLHEVIAYCHERDVKVYQAVNTVVYDDELPLLVDALQKASKLGVDALIIQDLAVYEIARKCCPEMKLHASTQMSIHTPSGVKMLKEMGFQRVVLSREMSRKEIEEVSQLGVETEVFVHGALCMCVSGQCYMSAMFGQRSGNRGLCAQSCRLPFSSTRQNNRFDLSLKDLSLVNQIRQLQEMGVASLKIEGRMKRPEYVAAAVTACRQAVDQGYVEEEVLQKLANVFSRSGFTSGYFDGKLGREMFGTRQKQDVTAADSATLKALEQLYQKEQQNIPVDASLTFSSDGIAVLELWDERGNRVSVQTDQAQAALNRPSDVESARRNLGKTGDTPYFLRDLTVENSSGMMLPAAGLNALRRDALQQLAAIRRKPRLIPFDAEQASIVFPKMLNVKIPELWGRFSAVSQIPQEADQLDRIIVPLEAITAGLAERYREKIAIELPRGKFGNEQLVFRQMKQAAELGCRYAVIANIGDIWLCRETKMIPIGGFGLNITNSLAMQTYTQLGVEDPIVSFELTLDRIRALGDMGRYGIIGYGRLPLMLTRNCPIKNGNDCANCRGKLFLTDRMGIQFPVVCRNGCSEILNSAVLYLADTKEELQGFNHLTLYFTDESRAQASRIIGCYTDKGEKPSSVTRGLYRRGSL